MNHCKPEMRSKCILGSGGEDRLLCENGGHCEHDPIHNEVDERFFNLLEIYNLQEHSKFPFRGDDLEIGTWIDLGNLRTLINEHFNSKIDRDINGK